MDVFASNEIGGRSSTVALDETAPKQCSCGTTRRAFVEESGGEVSVHLLQVDKAITHHHRVATDLRALVVCPPAANDADEYFA